MIEDLRGGDVPETLGGAVVAATGSCIVVGCRSESDGETRLVLADGGEIQIAAAPRFEGEIATPSGAVAVRNVLGETLLEFGAPAPTARVRVWLDDEFEPGEVVIGIS